MPQMTPNQFRRLALTLPGAVEGTHMGHADFRVGNKIFATLGYPDPAWGMVQLTSDQQALLVQTSSGIFSAVPGGWGRRGSTRVNLAAADPAAVKHALAMAWKNRAPKAALLRYATKTQTAMSSRNIDHAFARIRKAAKASKLPGIAAGTSYGTPSLNVAGKFLMRVKDADTFAFRCTMEEKAFLMEAEPAIYFETDHYVGWPIVLVRATASDAELIHCVARAWRLQAPKRLKAEPARPAGKAAKPQQKESPVRKSSRAKQASA
jgi:hypothetical protein